jgi:hypothetical protein
MPRLRLFLMSPFLPVDTRFRLRQQLLDREAAEIAQYVLDTPDVSVASVEAVDGRRSARGARLSPPSGGGRVVSSAQTPVGGWYTIGRVDWNGEQVTVSGDTGRSGRWEPEQGGLLPGFDAVEVFRAGRRPVTSGECPDRVAAIAAITLAGPRLDWVYFLDQESRELGSISAAGLDEDDLVRVTEEAGIAYRCYALTLARFSSLHVSPSGLCEVLFPRSARRVKLR